MSDDDLIRRGYMRELLQQCGLMGNHPNDPLTTMFNEIPATDARAEALREAARVAGDAAVAILLRNEPDASPLKQQLARQAVAVPILALIGGAK